MEKTRYQGRKEFSQAEFDRSDKPSKEWFIKVLMKSGNCKSAVNSDSLMLNDNPCFAHDIVAIKNDGKRIAYELARRDMKDFNNVVSNVYKDLHLETRKTIDRIPLLYDKYIAIRWDYKAFISISKKVIMKYIDEKNIVYNKTAETIDSIVENEPYVGIPYDDLKENIWVVSEDFIVSKPEHCASCEFGLIIDGKCTNFRCR